MMQSCLVINLQINAEQISSLFNHANVRYVHTSKEIMTYADDSEKTLLLIDLKSVLEPPASIIETVLRFRRKRHLTFVLLLSGHIPKKLKQSGFSVLTYSK